MTYLFPKFIIDKKNTSKARQDGFSGSGSVSPATLLNLLQKPTQSTAGGVYGKSPDLLQPATPDHRKPLTDNRSRISKISSTATKPKIETRADILALPLNPCLLCGCYKYLSGYCDHYRYRLPEPERECRCVHFKPRKH